MSAIVVHTPVDYVIAGHLTCDLTPQGCSLGGTAAYSGLTARALGCRVGILTSFGNELPFDLLDGIQVCNVPTKCSSTFENIYTPTGRIQYIHHVASDLDNIHLPSAWQRSPIFHVGPVAQEGKRLIEGNFGSSILGLTPQGWMRAWDEKGRIHPILWEEASAMLPKSGAVVISIEDVDKDEDQIERMAAGTSILAVTEGPAGSRIYWNGDLRRFHAPEKEEVDATGAGDIFAAAFFWRLYGTRDPWAAARFATHLASYSVMRRGLGSIPTREEIQACLVEVL